ncbi:MAG: hypothetical protein Q8Q08_08810 [Candidatus Omnitrophota bacterium]|nr:hypothetical protein [Candidatus Omnitrophota bacterium]MDZ4243365.1 hypothetical protein [Candidatus Omnitrophota bacterium]
MTSSSKGNTLDPLYIACATGVSLLLAFQVLMIGMAVSHFIPLSASDKTLFLTHHLPGIHPNRKILYYRIFVCAAVGIQLLQFFFLRQRTVRPEGLRNLKAFAATEAALTAFLIYGFLLAAMHTPWVLAWITFAPAAGLLILNKCLLWAFPDYAGRCQRLLRRLPELFAVPAVWDVLAVAFVVLTIYTPDISLLKSILYARDHLYHIDLFVMGPAWASLKGAVLNVDVYSQYGTVLPALFGRLSLFLGEFTYENVLKIILGMVMIYYLVFYAFLKLSFRNPVLALTGTLFLLKFQLFHLTSQWYVHPGRTVIRYFFDIFFFLMILAHLRTGKKGWLMGLAALSGFSVSYMTDTGAYLVFCFYVYLIALMFQPGIRRVRPQSLTGWLFLNGLCAAPIAVYFAFLGLSIGPELFRPDYWTNLLGFIKEAASGYGVVPFLMILKEGHIGSFLMSNLIPVAYLSTGLACMGLLIGRDGKEGRDLILPIVMSVYGLCLYHYYVWRSSDANYFIYCAPFIYIACFWLSAGLGALSVPRARILHLSLLCISLLVLLATPNFLKCPNVFNAKNKEYTVPRTIYNVTFDIGADVALIRQFTPPGGEACVISSFDVTLLMQADRKPFFYRFPFIVSSFFQSSDFHATTSSLKAEYGRELARLAEKKPEYVFLEKKIMVSYGAKEGERWLPEFKDYLIQHYLVGPEGKYLVALKRVSP